VAATVFVSSAIGAADNTTILETGAFTAGGSNRVLYVLAGSGAGTPVDPSAVKWGGSGGASLTKLGATLDMGSNAKASLWRLIAPATGSNTVHVTWGSAQDERWVIAVQVQDADQTTPNNTVATATGTNASPTVTATSVSGDLVLDFVSFLDIGGQSFQLTDDVPDSLQELEGAGGISAFEGAGASRETAAGTSTTCSWTVGGTLAGGGWSIFALAVNAAAAGSAQDLAGDAAGQASASGTLESILRDVPPPFGTRRNRPGRGPYSLGRFYRPSVAAYSNAIDLFGNAVAQATASAALQVLRTLAGDASGQASATGALEQLVPLAGAAAAQAGASGTLALSVLLNGAASSTSTASGALTTAGSVDLAGSAAGTASATGTLSLSVGLAGASIGVATASGQLAQAVPLNGAAIGVATASGEIALSIALSGAALSQASATASFAGVVTLGGDAAGQAGASGTLMLSVPLTGEAQGLASAGGGLVVTLVLGGSAQGEALAAGAVDKVVVLTGAAGGQVLATGRLSVVPLGVVPTWPSGGRHRIGGRVLGRVVARRMGTQRM
jgi:hypothetical protein